MPSDTLPAITIGTRLDSGMDGNKWISFLAAVKRVAPATGGEDQAKAALFERLGYRLAPWVDYPADDAGRPVKFARPDLQFHCPLRRRVASAPPKHRLLSKWEDGSPDWFGFLRQFSQDYGDDATWQTFLSELDAWLANDCGLMLDVGEVDRLMVDGDEWIPLWFAEELVLPLKPQSDPASGYTTGGRPAGDWILRKVYAGDIACAGHGAPVPPLEEALEFPSPAYFKVLNGKREIWKPEQQSVANDFYTDFYCKFAFGGGLFVSRRDVEKMVLLERLPDNRRIDATMRMSAWRYPEALAWVATKDRAEVARATHIVDMLIRLPAGHQSDVIAEWLGRLILITAWSHCGCNSRPAEGQESWETCGCVDAAVRDLVANGGEPAAKGIRFWQNNRVPGRFELDWPEGAERILFPVAEVMARWRAETVDAGSKLTEAKLLPPKRPGPPRDAAVVLAIEKVKAEVTKAGYVQPLQKGELESIKGQIRSELSNTGGRRDDRSLRKYADEIKATLPHRDN